MENRLFVFCIYFLPLKIIPVINLSFLIEFAKISTAITKSTPERGQPCLTSGPTLIRKTMLSSHCLLRSFEYCCKKYRPTVLKERRN